MSSYEMCFVAPKRTREASVHQISFTINYGPHFVKTAATINLKYTYHQPGIDRIQAFDTALETRFFC